MNKFLKKALVFPILGLLSGCSDTGSVALVKESTLDRYSKSITVGKAFDTWNQCDSVSWEGYKTERNEKIVQYICKGSGETVRKLSSVDFSNVMTLSDSDYEQLKEDTKYGLNHRSYEEVKAEEAYIYQKVDSIVYRVRFSIAVDGNSYKISYSGFDVNWKDGTQSTRSVNIISHIYRNEYFKPLTAAMYRFDRK
jgi:hypothetical protein